MPRALFTAASGMQVQQTNIDNIANNLAMSGVDQFGQTISGLTVTWSLVSGIGSINNSGLYRAPKKAGTAVIQAYCFLPMLIRNVVATANAIVASN